MGKIFLYILLTGTGITSLFRPWIGILAAYFVIVLTPQNIWWWHFRGIRPIYWIMMPTLIGFLIAFLQKRISLVPLKNKRNFYMAILWACFVLSYYWGPYVNISSEFRFWNPTVILGIVNKIFILYFLGCACINDEKKLKSLIFVILISVIYMIWWANSQYVFEGRYGRIGGPTGLGGGGVYGDENNFAMLFVVGLPFIYYMGFLLKNKLVRYGFWLIIPLGWHAIFLTGSRGGLVGLGVTLLITAVRSPKKIMGITIISAFIIAFMWQAGTVMQERSATIIQFTEDRSANTRLEAWDAAINMIQKNPLLGVGFTSFGPAFPDYSQNEPRQAHNTFLQISAESGIIAGIMYLLIITSSIIFLLKNSNNLKLKNKSKRNNIFFINEAVLTSFVGFIACSMFLSLQFFEIFFLMCVIINTLMLIYKNDEITIN